MKPFRKNVAIAIDGGGIKGTMVARALSILEDHLNQSCHEISRLLAGTSTGSIISAAIGKGLNCKEIHKLYCKLGETVFRRSLRSCLWPLFRFRYHSGPLKSALKAFFGDVTVGDLWSADPPTVVVITTFDLVENRTYFIKPYKEKYASSWSLVRAVLASCTVPTYFPVSEGRYVDGGLGAYVNPCYLAAYEAAICQNWNPFETTLISLGTGRDPLEIKPYDPNRFYAWNWIKPGLGAFTESTSDQQVNLVHTFFKDVDFRRFQIDFEEEIALDDPTKIPLLTKYGDELGQKILNDETDRALEITPFLPETNKDA